MNNLYTVSPFPLKNRPQLSMGITFSSESNETRVIIRILSLKRNITTSLLGPLLLDSVLRVYVFIQSNRQQITFTDRRSQKLKYIFTLEQAKQHASLALASLKS